MDGMGIDEHLEEAGDQERRQQALIHTSVDDCRCSLTYVCDIPFLEGLLVQLRGMEGQISRRQLVERRIRQLRRLEGCG
jgi:hypothetical protein